jgi:hypothetical protein
MDADFCMEALEEALARFDKPEIVTAQVTALTRGLDRSRASTSQRVDGTARRHILRR